VTDGSEIEFIFEPQEEWVTTCRRQACRVRTRRTERKFLWRVLARPSAVAVAAARRSPRVPR